MIMSLYAVQTKIDNVPCAMVLRGTANGQYQAVFERERASLEEIEAINWAQPTIEGDSPLPAGYGFQVEDISYSSATRSYTVALQVAEQFLGDVTGYVAQVEELEADVAGKAAAIRALEDQLAETDEALIALYEAQAVTQEGGEVSV